MSADLAPGVVRSLRAARLCSPAARLQLHLTTGLVRWLHDILADVVEERAALLKRDGGPTGP